MHLKKKSFVSQELKENINKAELQLGVKLPESYIQFISEGKYQDFGTMAIKISDPIPEKLKRYVKNGYIGFSGLFTIDLEYDDSSIMCTSPMIKLWGLPKGLVLLEGDGHTWIAFDYRKKSIDPPIIFIESRDCTSMEIAKNFKDLLEKMIPWDDIWC